MERSEEVARIWAKAFGFDLDKLREQQALTLRKTVTRPEEPDLTEIMIRVTAGR